MGKAALAALGTVVAGFVAGGILVAIGFVLIGIIVAFAALPVALVVFISFGERY
jgi:hypothetical protein